ncbi:unnamed protein product [Ectocarpus sp. CCAP 1310/34]|nr:unnamed protein product [Ectocarpus sp. CCAP 1310/34]
MTKTSGREGRPAMYLARSMSRSQRFPKLALEGRPATIPRPMVKSTPQIQFS